jgi:hypothetical protein
VQNYVRDDLQAMRTSMESMVVCGRDYYWSRAQGLDKVYGDDKTSTSQKVRTRRDGAMALCVHC